MRDSMEQPTDIHWIIKKQNEVIEEQAKFIEFLLETITEHTTLVRD